MYLYVSLIGEVMIPFHERIKVVFGALDTTPYRFANEHAGFTKVTLFNMLRPDKRPSFDVLERICEVEPRISAEYLLRGMGSPLRDAQRVTDLTTANGLEAFKQKIVAVLDQQIQELRETGQPS